MKNKKVKRTTGRRLAPVTLLAESERLKSARRIIRTAERWAKNQMLPEGTLCMAALKDVRRVLFS